MPSVGLAPIKQKWIRAWPYLFLEVELPTAPFFWGYISDGFREVPVMTVEIPRIVLALTVGLILRFGQDRGAILTRALAMPLRVFNAHLDDVRFIWREVTFGDREAPIARFHLNAMVRDPQANLKSERLRQPFGSNARIGINEHGDDSTRRHGPIRSHPQTVSLAAANDCGLVPATVAPRFSRPLRERGKPPVAYSWILLTSHSSRPRDATAACLPRPPQVRRGMALSASACSRPGLPLQKSSIPL